MTPRTNYQRGTEIENKIVKLFTEKGYTAQRTAGSHSLVDILIFNYHEVKFIQSKRCKTSKIPNSIYKELEKFKTMDCPDCVGREFWVWVDRQGFTILWKSIDTL